MDEREFLYSLCAKALEVENSIKFAAVINHDGKLIVGKPMRCTTQPNKIMDNHIFNSKPINSYLNFSNYNYNLNSSVSNENTIHSNLFYKSDFQLIYINKNIFIALTPLNEEQDKYLCIYFESNNSLHKTLLKLNTIFEYAE